MGHAKDLFNGLFSIVLTLVVWGCLYLPYALDYIRYQRIPGESPAFFEDLFLGLFI